MAEITIAKKGRRKKRPEGRFSLNNPPLCFNPLARECQTGERMAKRGLTWQDRYITFRYYERAIRLFGNKSREG